MKTFIEFIHEMAMGGIPTNNVAHSGQTNIAKYDPIMKFKMFRRKPKKKEKK